MQLVVLGPMEVVSGTERLALGGPKQRLVLGMLAAARRRTVTLDELVDGLWPVWLLIPWTFIVLGALKGYRR